MAQSVVGCGSIWVRKHRGPKRFGCQMGCGWSGQVG